MGVVPGGTAGRQPDRGLLLSGYSRAQMCKLARDLYIGLAFWMTPFVTLVVQSVRSDGFSANAHLLIGDLPAPGNHHMVDVDGIVAVPENPLVNAEKPPFLDQGFDQAYHMPDGEAGDAGDAFIGNLGVFAVEVGFGEDNL